MSSFQGSYKGIGQMLRSDFMMEEMLKRGQRILEIARAEAPVGNPKTDPHSGRYKDSFKIRVSRRGGWSNNRAEAKVFNTAPEAIYVEYGNNGREPYHTLLNALLEGAHNV